MARWMFRTFRPTRRPYGLRRWYARGSMLCGWRRLEREAQRLWWALVRTAVAPPPFDTEVAGHPSTFVESPRSRTRRPAPYVPVTPLSTNSIHCAGLSHHTWGVGRGWAVAPHPLVFGTGVTGFGTEVGCRWRLKATAHGPLSCGLLAAHSTCKSPPRIVLPTRSSNSFRLDPAVPFRRSRTTGDDARWRWR